MLNYLSNTTIDNISLSIVVKLICTEFRILPYKVIDLLSWLLTAPKV